MTKEFKPNWSEILADNKGILLTDEISNIQSCIVGDIAKALGIDTSDDY